MRLSIEFDYITGHVVLQTPRGYKTFDLADSPLLAELKRWDRHSRIKEEEEIASVSGNCTGCGKAGNVVPLAGAVWHLSCWHNAKLPKPAPITKIPEGKRTLIAAHPDGTLVRKINTKKLKKLVREKLGSESRLLTLEDLGEL